MGCLALLKATSDAVADHAGRASLLPPTTIVTGMGRIHVRPSQPTPMALWQDPNVGMHTSDQNTHRYPETLAIRLPEHLKTALFARANAADRTPSALVRRLIREHLDTPLRAS